MNSTEIKDWIPGSYLMPTDAFDAIAKLVTPINVDLFTRRNKFLDSQVERDELKVADFDGFEETPNLLFRLLVGFVVELLRQNRREGFVRTILLSLEDRGRFEDDGKVEVVRGADWRLPPLVLRVHLKIGGHFTNGSLWL